MGTFKKIPNRLAEGNDPKEFCTPHYCMLLQLSVPVWRDYGPASTENCVHLLISRVVAPWRPIDDLNLLTGPHRCRPVFRPTRPTHNIMVAPGDCLWTRHVVKGGCETWGRGEYSGPTGHQGLSPQPDKFDCSPRLLFSGLMNDIYDWNQLCEDRKLSSSLCRLSLYIYLSFPRVILFPHTPQ